MDNSGEVALSKDFSVIFIFVPTLSVTTVKHCDIATCVVELTVVRESYMLINNYIFI